ARAEIRRRGRKNAANFFRSSARAALLTCGQHSPAPTGSSRQPGSRRSLAGVPPGWPRDPCRSSDRLWCSPQTLVSECRVAQGDGRCRPRLVIDERELADDLALSHQRDDAFFAPIRRNRDFDQALLDAIAAIAA